jgi:hypothetical protein
MIKADIIIRFYYTVSTQGGLNISYQALLIVLPLIA